MKTISRANWLLFCLAFFASLLLWSAGNIITTYANSQTEVGIWYSTWYTTEGNYDWLENHAVGASNAFLEDVTGDGKADLVYYFNAYVNGYSGSVYVAKSNGNGFENPERWRTTTVTNATKVMMGDVTGDGKSDLVHFYASTGSWYVTKTNSDGTGMHSTREWRVGGMTAAYGRNSDRQILADVDGVNGVDAVTIYDNWHGGRIYVALSNGSADSFANFGNYWLNNFNFGNYRALKGDIDNDSKDELVMYNKDYGSWYALQKHPSLNQFSNPSQWMTAHGAGSNNQFIADSDGDGYDDAAFYFQNGFTTGGGASVPSGSWYRARSNGGSFQPPNYGSPWKYHHGNSHYRTSTHHYMGDVDGNGVGDPVAADLNTGKGVWSFLPGDGPIEPPAYNSWQAWNVLYKPIVNGVPRVYGSSESAVIDEHLAMIDNAGVDYVLLDLTNNIETGYVESGAMALCSRLAAHNNNGGDLKFAVAVGGIQFQDPHDPEKVEQEAGIAMNRYVQNGTCGQHYYQKNGKPLLVAYGNHDEIQGPNGWEAYQNKSHTNNFTVIPALSMIPGTATPGASPSYFGNGCGDINTVPQTQPTPNRYGDTLAWGMPFGTQGNGPIMSVMPGWGNKDGQRILRQIGGIHGEFYNQCGWNRILSSNNVEMVVINSFNEFVERTALMPADTSDFPTDPSDPNSYDRWPNNNFYWTATQQYISQL